MVRRHGDDVNVIGHPAVSRDFKTVHEAEFPQEPRIKISIFVAEKYRHAPDSSLNDVMEISGDDDTGNPGHICLYLYGRRTRLLFS
jgi:hypothetical protein